MGISTKVLQSLATANAMTLDELVRVTRESRDEIVKAIQVLKKRKLVRTADNFDRVFAGHDRGYYHLTVAGRKAAEEGVEIKPGRTGERPRKRTAGLRERAWWHLRNHAAGTLNYMLDTYAEGTEKAAHVNLYKYLRALEAAAIVKRRSMPARQAKGQWLWVLVRDVGPLAPVWRSSRSEVFDPNSGQVIPIGADAVGARPAANDAATGEEESEARHECA